jgi:O-antigen/teichoic acid export membrane protein
LPCDILSRRDNHRRKEAIQNTGGLPAIAHQVIRGSFLSIGASAVTITLGFLRAILLARLLLPEHFGVVTLALFFISLAEQLRAFGLDTALVHHLQTDKSTFSTYFSLRFGTLGLSLGLLLLAQPLLVRFYPTMPLLGGVLLAFIVIEVGRILSIAQETLLTREMAFRGLAVANVLSAVLMTAVAPLLASRGWGVWSLVAEQATGILARTVYIWLAYPSCRPRFGWDGATARWFWNYGRPSWVATNLNFLLDHFDDFWVGTTLGQTPLGYYSRAYEFAHYPRRVVANPLANVFLSAFARLQHDRLRLSQAFFRSASAIVRFGFWIAGGFALIMPEFIHLIVGDQWRPMLLTFRLMLIYTMLDSLLTLCAHLFLATGYPVYLRRVRLTQILFFIPAVILGARWAGIEGVALAADGMLVVGAVVFYFLLRRIVHFSSLRIFLWPSVAFALAWGGGLSLERASLWQNLWLRGGTKLALYTVLYLGILFLTERSDYQKTIQTVVRALRGG